MKATKLTLAMAGVLFSVQLVTGQGISYGTLVGISRDKAIGLFDYKKENWDFKNVVSGDYFVLKYSNNIEASMVMMIQLEFDKSNITEATTCKVVTLAIPKLLLEEVKKMLSSSFPLYDDETRTYLNETIAARIVEDSTKELLYVVYFNH